MKPTQILSKLCKENKLDTPHYFQDRVAIGKYCMTFSDEEVIAWNGPSTCRNRDEHLALAALHRWSEFPNVGCKVGYIVCVSACVCMYGSIYYVCVCVCAYGFSSLWMFFSHSSSSL